MSMLMRFALSAVALSALTTGCASSPRQEITIYEGPPGAVYLEPVSGRHFQAAHPISLSPSIITQVLGGVQVRDEKTAIQTILGSVPKDVRAFSDEEIEFLTPLIVNALQKATSDQQVKFKTLIKTASGPETTAATLYAHGLSLHLTLDEYRHKPSGPDDINMPINRLPDPGGLDHREVMFIPEAARRPATYQQSSLSGTSDNTTLVIDYGYLAKGILIRSEPASPTVSQLDPTVRPDAPTTPIDSRKGTEKSSSNSVELQSLKDLVIKKDMELENLKQEIRLLRRQLAERDAQIDNLLMKRKNKSTPRVQEPAP